MSKPRVADLFCGAGGAARGLQQAGFYVVGFDINPQPRYAGDEFRQQDALTVDLSGFDAVWASPPCQYYSRLRHLPWLKDREYWDSIPPTKAHLAKFDVPWILENVADAPIPNSVMLCGQMFGLPIFRHRRFESSANVLLMQPPHVKHTGVIASGNASMAKRYASGSVGVKEISRESIAGHAGGVARNRKAMGIEWMTAAELSQAIPPAYSLFLGQQLLRYMERAA